ncbi:glycoside hydrolase family 16 protein [Piedraia hortae CBS 480.64]|uniref:Glycoside hydrolase family 16 protein n=1 Tax=Piedraia hortae CBS 480.64 TaxID=1314780 RepID=A0A6A7C5C3_9PEZI|nr:glycoside hydrolase family 16 protein [Piedraia hortae CBS 480.64]
MFTTALVTVLLLQKVVAAPTPTSSSSEGVYTLVSDHSGTDFFSGFKFESITDPTQGYVRYVNTSVAQHEKLAGYIFNSTNSASTAYLGVDHSSTNLTSSGRKSTRITSYNKYSNGALVVADIRHMPLGVCGTWGALWMTGDNWPHSGEIDIIEGVNDNQFNSMTLHTSAGCSVSNETSTPMLGRLGSISDCDGLKNNNAGCGISAPEQANLAGGVSHPTAGSAFNAAGGGVYAMHWTAKGINIYLFPHNLVPNDLASGSPDPSSWTAQPLARFAGNDCDYAKKFSAQAITINTDLCGEWAGNVWNQTSCATQTGFATCEEFVKKRPDLLKEAYWEIGGVKVFQTEVGTVDGPGKGMVKRDVVGRWPIVRL